MKLRVAIAATVLLVAAPLFAQAPKGWKMRVDRSMNASDPDAAGASTFVTSGSGFRATNPKAAVYWNPQNVATGSYTLKGKFTLIKDSGHDEYYGLVFGGSDLEGPAQNYLYFLITDDGTFLVKRRTGDASTQSVFPKTENAAVKKPGADGSSVNELEVRVKPDKIDFAVNGRVVTSMPKSGATAKTDGIYGLRINHHLEVQVDGFGVSKM
jgi:hypothetical protein